MESVHIIILRANIHTTRPRWATHLVSVTRVLSKDVSMYAMSPGLTIIYKC